MGSKNFFSKFTNWRNRDEISPEEIKEIKIMILLKSMVFGLFIVLITLFVAFFIIKSHHLKKVDHVLKCDTESFIMIEEKIEQVDLQNNVITVISADKSGHNKVVTRINADCGNEINRINLITKRK